MDWESIKANWIEYKLNARSRWARLTRDDLERIAGRREQLMSRLRELYALDEVEAQQQLDAWQSALRKDDPFK
jgi:uncharacterized protein YjbJ (UPF0337 family)